MNNKIVVIGIITMFLLTSTAGVSAIDVTKNNESKNQYSIKDELQTSTAEVSVIGITKNNESKNQYSVKDKLQPANTANNIYADPWYHIYEEGDWQDILYIPAEEDHPFHVCWLSQSGEYGAVVYEFNFWGSEISKVEILYKERGLVGNGPDLYIYNFITENWECLLTDAGPTGDKFLWVGKDLNYNEGYIKQGNTDRDDKVRIKVYAEEDQGFVIPWAGDEVQLRDICITYTPRLRVPNLECTNKIVFPNTQKNIMVSSAFNIKNIGDKDSNLNWKIDTENTPDFGIWTFSPQEGAGLKTADTIAVSVSVTPIETGDLVGRIKIINLDNPEDCEELVVSIIVTKSKTINKPFLQFLQQHPLLNQLLQRCL